MSSDPRSRSRPRTRALSFGWRRQSVWSGSRAAGTGETGYGTHMGGRANMRLRGQAALGEILGDERVTRIRVCDVNSGEVEVLETSAVLVYVGLEPNTAFVCDLIEFDAAGCIP